MVEVVRSIDVDVAVMTAFGEWERFESFPRFMGGVRRVERLDDRRTHWVTEVGGVRREFDADITDLVPGERIAWTSVGEGTDHAGEVTFEPLGDAATRVTVRIAWEPDGLAERTGSALGLDELQVKSDLERFKAYIEDDRVTAAEWHEEMSALHVGPVVPGQA